MTPFATDPICDVARDWNVFPAEGPSGDVPCSENNDRWELTTIGDSPIPALDYVTSTFHRIFSRTDECTGAEFSLGLRFCAISTSNWSHELSPITPAVLG